MARDSSRRRRWRISCCDFSWSDHRLGSPTFFSISANWSRREAASKIAPQIAYFVAHRSVFAFQFFNHKSVHVERASSMVRAENLKRTNTARNEITTHIQAKTSPLRL